MWDGVTVTRWSDKPELKVQLLLPQPILYSQLLLLDDAVLLGRYLDADYVRR
jgi:hypothetical protein